MTRRTHTTAQDTPRPTTLPDIQGRADERLIAIDKVGVKEIRYPIALATPTGDTLNTVADINMYVSLPAERKGTHMSRFLEVLNEYADGIQPDRIAELCQCLRKRLDAADAHVEMEFTYFIKKFAPVSGKAGLMDYRVKFSCSSNGSDDFIMTVTAPATSLCPCSKEISEYGAHNQRTLITVDARFSGMVWIEDLVDMMERSASCEVYSVLKRPDEKAITERAYENPKFVEDIVRDLAVRLNADDRIQWYCVRSENFESIHSHNAYAEIIRDKR